MPIVDVITSHRLKLLGLDPEMLSAHGDAARAQAIYEAFLARVPYENLSNNRAVAAEPESAERWPRATDRLLRENQVHGLGGTSFSLSYCLRDLLRGVGITAHCTLGYNLVTEQAHAAVVVYVDEGPLLYDPALLVCGPIPVRPGGELDDPLGTVRLEPRVGPTLTVTLELRCGDRHVPPGHEIFEHAPAEGGGRAIYSIIPVPAPPQSFRQAWLASFYRGRPMPLRMARRDGDRIIRYGERPGSIEILAPDGREEITVGHDVAEHLHGLFGIDPACLRMWFERAG